MEGGIDTPGVLGLMAAAYGKAGHVEEGLTLLAEALAAVEKNGTHVAEALLYRIKGELTLQKFQVSSSQFHPAPNP
jgi:hypothetical protein